MRTRTSWKRGDGRWAVSEESDSQMFSRLASYMHPFPYVDAVNFAFRPWLTSQSVQELCSRNASSSRVDCSAHGIPTLSDYLKSPTQPPLVKSSRLVTPASAVSLPSLDPVTDDEELVDSKEPVGMTLSPIPSSPDETVSETVGSTVSDAMKGTVSDAMKGTVSDAITTPSSETPMPHPTGEKTLTEPGSPSDWHSVFVNPPLHRVLFRSIANGINSLISNVNAAEKHPAITNYSAIPFGDADSEDYDRIMKRVSVAVGARREA